MTVDREPARTRIRPTGEARLCGMILPGIAVHHKTGA